MMRVEGSGMIGVSVEVNIEVPAVPLRELSAQRPGTSSAEMREQVMLAREAQGRRFASIRTRQSTGHGL